MANNKTKFMSDEAYQALLDRLGLLRETLAAQSASVLIQNPQMAELLNARVDDLLTIVDEGEAEKTAPPDGGLAGLVGIGSDASRGLGEVRVAPSVKPYDEVITPERIRAVADLYYIYQHEMLGVFRVTLKLQELFKAGVVRLSFGDGAGRLYRYDRRQVLRYTQLDRMHAYLRALGFTIVRRASGAMPTHQFHGLFSQFVAQVARFFRD